MTRALDVTDNHSLMRQILKFLVYFEFFHQQKKVVYVEKTYSITFLKQITPEELYSKKVTNKDNFMNIFYSKFGQFVDKFWRIRRSFGIREIVRFRRKSSL